MQLANNQLRVACDSDPIDQNHLLGVAVESVGKASKLNLHNISLNRVRRLYMLFSSGAPLPEEGDIRPVQLSNAFVNERALSVSDDKDCVGSMGAHYGWAPMMHIDGAVEIEEVRNIPWTDSFLDISKDPGSAIAIGTLYRDATITIPDPVLEKDADQDLYIFGQTIRIPQTFPNDPGGGSRLVA